jgi:ketosteroid isomerase-like protein
MSQENVEIVRRIVEDGVRGSWEASAQHLGPDTELHGTVGGLTEGSVWRGSEQVRKFFEEDSDAWDERRLDAEEFIDAGDCVVVLLHEFRRGKGSGVEIETDTAMVFELGGRHVVRIQGYMNRADALEAAGLWD